MAVRAAQSNAMKYSLITFVALFLISTTLAVIFYLQAEEFRGLMSKAESDYRKAAGSVDLNGLTRLVGKPEENQSYLATMNLLIDKLYKTIVGVEPEAGKPATVKVNEVAVAVTKIQEYLGEDATPAYGPGGISLTGTIASLKNSLTALREQTESLQSQFAELQTNFDQSKQEWLFNENQLKQEALQYQQTANAVQAKFDELQMLMENSKDEQIQEFKNRLEEEQAKLKQKQLDLVEMETSLQETKQSLQGAVSKLDAIQGTPDINHTAYQPDAQIIRVDLRNGLIYLDVGARDHVYRGLTFAVYDRNTPIPEDGKGKAEVEVFQVNENVCAARVLRSTVKNPIVEEDIVANLVWNPKTSNHFVVSGEFDLNGDGFPEQDSAQRIKEMILRWGGTVDDEITIDTDFAVVGIAPKTMPVPSQAHMDMDPMVMQKYEESVRKTQAYSEMLEKAKLMSVPLFNQKQFYYLLGYETLASKN